MYKKNGIIILSIIFFLFFLSACEKKSNSVKNIKSVSVKRKPEGKKSVKIKIGTFNLKFFGDTDKENNSGFGEFGKNIRESDDNLMEKIFELIKDVDILAVQEVENKNAISGLVDYLNNRSKSAKYKYYMYARKSSCQNIGLIWNTKKLNGWRGYKFEKSFNIVDKTEERDIRFSRTPIYNFFEVGEVKFAVVAVHLKAKGVSEDGGKREKEAKKLVEWIEHQKIKENNEHVILIGDFNDRYTKNLDNTDLDPLIESDKSGKIIFLTKSFDETEFYSNFGEYKGKIYNEIIDHIIIAKSMENHYIKNSCKILMHNNDKISDHNPVIAEFDFSE
ncbi:hypothetical protein KA977_09795 [Candidatus Dependentiae bacterium]|nr:hypothetical protein [Candidatus Dependentiae bacterium]